MFICLDSFLYDRGASNEIESKSRFCRFLHFLFFYLDCKCDLCSMTKFKASFDTLVGGAQTFSLQDVQKEIGEVLESLPHHKTIVISELQREELVIDFSGTSTTRDYISARENSRGVQKEKPSEEGFPTVERGFTPFQELPM